MNHEKYWRIILFSIVIFYGLLENISRLIKIFFQDLKIDFEHEILLKEYRKFRNSIAHGSIIHDNGSLIYVDFKTSNGLIELKSIKKLGTHVDHILNEIRIIFVLLSQIIELYQLTDQLCR